MNVAIWGARAQPGGRAIRSEMKSDSVPETPIRLSKIGKT